MRLDVSKSGDFGEKQVVRAAGVEPTTSGFGGQRSIQLSYARKKILIQAQEHLPYCKVLEAVYRPIRQHAKLHSQTCSD